jgi:hypothetical protein
MFSRRHFLAGVSANALAAFLPRQALQAASPHSVATAATQVSAPASVVNGFDEAGGNSFPFINFAKVMGSQGGSVSFQGLMNTDGYPKGALTWPSQFASVVALDSTLLDPSVTWVLSWQGNGGIQVSNGIVINQTNFIVTAGSSFVGGSSTPFKLTNVMTASGQNGYIEFTNGPGAFQFGLTFSSFVNYDGTMSNLQLYRKSDQAALKSGQIFTPEFLTNLRSLNVKVIRMMDWGQTNFNNASRFAYRTALSAFSYYNVRWNSSLWAGITAGSSTAYVCARPQASGSGSYVDGETVQVQFHTANTSTTPTLNVGGRGAVPIQLDYAAPLTAGTISANTCATLVYDAWLNVWLADFSIVSANNAAGGLTTGVPIEIQVALCNALGADLWHNFPFHYDDASCAATATYVRDNLNPTQKAYFEYSNEVWNWGFSQTSLAAARGAYLGFPNSSNRQFHGYYGLRVRQIMAAVTSAWSPRSITTLRRVLALWEADPSPMTANMYRLRGADLDTRLNYSNYNSVVGAIYSSGGPLFTRPIDMCDTLSYATYYAGPNLGGNSGSLSGLNAADIASLKAAADSYATGSATSNQALIASSLAWVDNDIRRGSTQKLLVTIASDLTTLTASSTAPAANTPVVFSSTGTLPTGLSSTAVYYIVNPRGSSFQVSASYGGVPLGGISGGDNVLYVGSLGGETLLWHKTFNYADPNSLGLGWEQVAATYDGFRPPGFSNIKIECYEGGLEACPPSQGQCNAVGLAGTTYGTSISYSTSGYLMSGTGGTIYNLLQAYKNSPSAKQLVIDQFTQFMAYAHSSTPAWYAIQGYSQWSLMPGDTLSTPYQSFNGIATYNSGSK